MPYIDKVSLDGTVYDIRDTDLRENTSSGLVRYDSAQALTDAQKTQVRNNIGANSPDELNELKAYVTKISPLATVGSSSLLTIFDAAPLEAESVFASIKPVQNLNGYLYPWPAGSRKNLLPELIKGVGINQTTGAETTNANYASSDYIPVTLTSNDDYYLSGITDALHTNVSAYNASQTYLGRTSGRNSNGFRITQDMFTYGTPSGTGDIAYLRVAVYKASTDDASIDEINNLQIQLEAGSVATAYEPCSNICPFTGFAGATVRRTGKNLLNDTSRYIGGSNNIYLSFEGDRNSFPTFLRAGQYTLSVEFLNGAHYGAYIGNSDETVAATLWTVTSSTTQVTFTLPYDDYYRIWLYKSDGVSSDNVGHVQLEPGSVATPYEPYQGGTYTVTFPSSAGTVYGGILDLVAGTLTVDVAYALLNDASKWTSNAGSSYNFLYDVNFSNRKKYSDSFTGLLCSYCNNAGTSSVDTVRWTSASSNKMGMKLANGTLDQVKADATAGKIAIVYDLAEPVVHTLDPVTLTMLRGANVLWADCGEMSLSYRQDVATLLSALTAPDETDMTADANYAANSFFTVGGTLYRATAAIANGETIQPGVNCVATSIAEQLTYLYTQI